MKKTITVTVSFRDKDSSLVNWVEGQAKKKYLKLGSFSSVIRKCIEIVRDKSLLV